MALSLRMRPKTRWMDWGKSISGGSGWSNVLVVQRHHHHQWSTSLATTSTPSWFYWGKSNCAKQPSTITRTQNCLPDCHGGTQSDHNHDDDGGAHSDNDDGDAGDDCDSDDDDDGAKNILTNQVEIGQGSSNPLDGPRRCRHSHNNCGLRAGDCDGDPMALK